MSLETYVALFALLISLVSTVISLWTLRAQINISKNSAFFAQGMTTAKRGHEHHLAMRSEMC